MLAACARGVERAADGYSSTSRDSEVAVKVGATNAADLQVAANGADVFSNQREGRGPSRPEDGSGTYRE